MKHIAIFFLGLCAAFPVLANDECEAAVDAADSMNVNQKDCDYSKEGLNGFLQKAFKKGSEGAVLETSGNSKSESPEAIEKNNKVAPAKSNVRETAQQSFRLSVEVDQWANLPVARAQLLPKALEKCGKGFSITGEHYRSLAMGRIELQLQFECDK
ncbi:hypothetical protein [Cellvibrio sp. UBA7661]|uniref:hypothetical protein n=1 Tax=Cellvibrio sp. UBA7661 TaxID=1946311 RepID=UPI002F359DED